MTGWGLLIAGIGLTVIHPSLESFSVTFELVLLVLAVVVLGTIIPFQLFTNALKYIRPTTASMLDAFEPIAQRSVRSSFLAYNSVEQIC